MTASWHLVEPGAWASEPGFRYMKCLHGRNSVQLARAARKHVPTMYIDTCEQLCVSNNEICGAAVAVKAEKQHLGCVAGVWGSEYGFR